MADGDKDRHYSKEFKANTWQKGQSGNPAGRPKGSGSILKAMQDTLGADDGLVAREMVTRMLDILRNDDGLAVKVFKDFTDRMEGRATEHKEITIKDTTKLVVLEDEGDEEEGEDDA